MSRGKTFHDEHTRLISLKPSVIGLDGIVLSTGEAHIFNGKGGLYHEPDGLCFDPSTKTLYNIEYKCNGFNKKAALQLRETSHVLQTVFEDYKIINLYVSENYKVELVK